MGVSGNGQRNEHRLPGRTAARSPVRFRVRRGVLPRRRTHWKRSALAGLAAVVLLVSTGCGSSPDQVAPQAISYAAAADRLSGMEPAEVTEQLRDWARTGLAALLELDTARFRDAMYDTVPVRDPAFVDLAEQPTGPGRALFDGQVLHVLVPWDDPHQARTIGLLIDDHRADTGTDPQQVRVHHYQINQENRTITLTSDEPAPTAAVRSANGYLEMRVDESGQLADFLAQTQHLSWLQKRGTEIWAGGWRWPGTPGAQLTPEDISAIQRGYLAFAQQDSLAPDPMTPPGFSLDPRPPETLEDFLALLPDLDPGLVYRLATDQWTDSPFQSADHVLAVVDSALFRNDPPPATLAEVGLPTDRAQLWAFQQGLLGGPMYSQTRYEGGLAGTEVGMTLFYTDVIAKDWTGGVGNGVPAEAVGGFVPITEAVTPWSHCPESDESGGETGRLWFGQNESGFTFAGDRVSIGSRATRLFARSDAEGGLEVERSYAFGRGLRWWDQHYQQVADYEQQYHRLDQIMRWSGALEWLVTQAGGQLPQLDDSAIRSDLRFAQWYADRDDLLERSPIEFVQPPSAAGQEALLAKPSEAFDLCGSVRIKGGVSLGDLIQRKGDRSYQADLPLPLRRAGLYDEKSFFDPATGVGHTKQLSIGSDRQIVDTLERRFSATPDGAAVVQVTGDGRQTAAFGGLKVWRDKSAPRQFTVEIAADEGRVSQHASYQGYEMGELTAVKDVNTVTIMWKSGVVDRVRRILESVQNWMASGPGAGPPPAIEGVLYSYSDGAGGLAYKVGGSDSPWLSIKEPRPPGTEMSFRFGGPDQGGGGPVFYQADFVSAPVPLFGGKRSEWIEVTPGPAGQPATIAPIDPPDPTAAKLPVSTPDRQNVTIYLVDDRPRVPADDQILGVSGRAEGAALLRDYPKITAARHSATQAGDGLLRGVVLGQDGVALVGAEQIFIAGADHAWTTRVLAAIDPRHPDRLPLMHIDGGRVLHVYQGKIKASAESERMSLADLAEQYGSSRDVYASERLRTILLLADGVTLRDPLPSEPRVVVREAEFTDNTGTEGPSASPDIARYQDTEYQRLPFNPGGVGRMTNNGQAVFVCTEDDPDATDCEE